MSPAFGRVTALFILYGFLIDFKPSEPFLYPFLVDDKGLSPTDVDAKVYPVWGYAYLVSLLLLSPLVAVVGEKSALLLGSLARIATRLLLLWGQSLATAQAAELAFGIGSATEIVYYAYAFAHVPKGRFQLISSLTRAAPLVGHVASAALGQVLHDVAGLSLWSLFAISSVTVGASAVVAFLLPRRPQVRPPPRASAGAGAAYTVLGEEIVDEIEEEEELLIVDEQESGFKARASMWIEEGKATLLQYRKSDLLLWSVWWALVLGAYGVALNWMFALMWRIEPGTQKNGYVSALVRLAGAIGALVVVPLRSYFRLHSHPYSVFVGACATVFMGITLVVLSFTELLMIGYALYSLYEFFVSFAVSLAAARLAGDLDRRQYAAVFVVNTVAAVLVQDTWQGLCGYSGGLFGVWVGHPTGLRVLYRAIGAFVVVSAVLFGAAMLGVGVVRSHRKAKDGRELI